MLKRYIFAVMLGVLLCGSVFIGGKSQSAMIIKPEILTLNQTLFIGDSLTVGMASAPALQGAHFLAHVGEDTSQMNAHLDDLLTGNTSFKTVVILGGVNDIASGHPAEWTMANLAAMYQKARQAGLKVYACTLTPWGKYQLTKNNPELLQAKTQQINNWIKSQPDITVIDLNSHMAAADTTLLNPALSEADGLHPNAAGYQHMSKQIKLVANFQN